MKIVKAWCTCLVYVTITFTLQILENTIFVSLYPTCTCKSLDPSGNRPHYTLAWAFVKA